MACRFPGAPSPQALWRLLIAGDHALREVPSGRWVGSSYVDPDRRAPGKMVTARGGFLDQVEGFDARFFGISAREASAIDPQQRLALELAWEALEHAGLPPGHLRGTDTSVFMGAMWTDYARLHGIADIEQHSGTGWHLGVVPGRVSYALGLRGPSMAVNTACSSSLVAVHLACQALRAGETSLALAGGVSLMLTPHVGVAMSKFGGTSASGRCFAYDARADGYVRGEGGGVLALRRYSDALARGERILALIRASGVNNDGLSPGLTVPSEAAQRELLREVYERAGVEPREVFYVEGHGTGTPVGDPIEARALGAELGRGRAQPLWLGSIKPNIGHTEAASGVASLIKTALALDRGLVPPNRNFAQPNPAIDFDGLALRVPTAPQPWDGPRLAGVNSFGFGGTNCHVVLAGAPARVTALQAANRAPTPARAVTGPTHPGHRLIAVSARDRAALDARLEQLRELVAGEGASLDDLSHTLWHRRDHLEHRAFVCAASLDELAARLGPDEPIRRAAVGPSRPPLAFVFSGQGSQWAKMGRSLAAELPAFRQALAECSTLIEALTGWSPLAAIEAGTLADQLERVDGIQPAIFAVQVALAATWRSLGLEPDAVIGHSMGEVSAAVAAGAISLADGVKITCERARLLGRISGAGGMLSINLPTAEIEALISAPAYAGLGIAVDLGLDSTIVSGGLDELAQLRATIEGERPGVEVREVAVDVAAHSPQIDALADEFLAAIADVSSRPSTVRMLSSVTGAEVDHRDLTPAYWVRNLRWRVRFGEAAGLLLDAGISTFVELSPHPLLRWPLGQLCARRGVEAPCVLASMRRARPELEQLLTSVGELHLRGFELDLDQPGSLVELPAYPWQRRRFWPRAPRAPGLSPSAAPTPSPSAPELVIRVDARRLPALLDHRVDGQAQLGAGLALELFARAWASVEPDAELCVEGLRFDAPIAGERGVRLELRAGQVELGPADPSPTEAPAAAVRAQLSSLPSSAQLPRPRPLQLTRERSSAAHYARLDASGVGYGPSLRAVESVALGPGTACGCLAPGQARAALFDALFQTVCAALDDPSPVLVASVARARLTLARLPRATTVHASIHAVTEHERLAEAWLLDERGTAIVHLEGVRLVTRARVGHEGPLRQRSWRALEPRDDSRRVPARVLALAPPGSAAASALIDQLAGPASPTELVFVDEAGPVDALLVACPAASPGEAPPAWTRAAAARVLAAFHRALELDPDHPPRVVIVGERAAVLDSDVPAQVNPGGDALAALSRVAVAEHPQLRAQVFDLSSFGHADEVATLAEALVSGRDQPSLAIRGRTCFAPILTAVRAPREPWVPRPGTILVTGALGGIGRAVTEHLAELGAERLVLVGRRPLDDEGARLLAAIEARTGASLRYLSVDISERATLERALASELDALVGIIHTAADLASAALVDHDAEALDAALRPKLAGAWHLHELTLGRELDFFVMFGSLGAWVGLPGQAGYAAANAALDSLAALRRGLGLPAVTIGWCGWRGLGFARSAGGSASLQRLANEGIGALEPEAALALFERILGAGTELPPSFAIMPEPAAADSEATRAAATRAELGALPEPERRALVHERVLAEAAAVLRDEPGHIDPRRPLRDLGLDSLMSVELAERLSRSLGLPASNTLIWRYPTVEALAGHALAELGALPEPRTTAPAEPEPDPGLGEAELDALVDELGDLSDEEVEALTRVL